MGRLEEELARRLRRGAAWDRPHPGGAAIGGFDFEGNWHFSFFPDLVARSVSELWPEREEVGVRAEGEEGWSCRTGSEEYGRMVREAQEEIR